MPFFDAERRDALNVEGPRASQPSSAWVMVSVARVNTIVSRPKRFQSKRTKLDTRNNGKISVLTATKGNTPQPTRPEINSRAE
jgi:hypothetical protein